MTHRQTHPEERSALVSALALAVAHTCRFRRVSNRYPRRVNEAYGFDVERALADDDATVAATVEAWERAHGLAPRDWMAIGREEGRCPTA